MNRIITSLFFILCLSPSLADAANRFVRPGATGRNDGSDWINAYTNLPSNLTRGDTYYLASGMYGSYTFATPNSGSTQITVKKAIDTDHGTDVGWSSAYGAGQAVFRSWLVYTDYYVFDGQRRNSNWRQGATSEYGIKVAGSGPLRLDNGNGTGGDSLTFRYIDFVGGGRDSGTGDDVVYGLTGNTNLTFQFCALHDSDRTIFLTRNNWTNLVVDQSYMARNTSTPANHGELMSVYSSTNMTFSNNVIEDIEGTAVWAGIGDGGSNGWKIYGNVISHSAAYAANTGRSSTHNHGISGVIFIASDATNNNRGDNVQFYNNTMVNIVGTWSGVIIQSGAGNEVRNNVWYGSVRTNNSFNGAISNNWYFNTLVDGDATGTKTVCASGCDIFSSIAGKDFRLRTGIGGGMALGAPYNTDMNGALRGVDGTWDRGAFEFNTSGATALQPPSGLTVR